MQLLKFAFMCGGLIGCLGLSAFADVKQNMKIQSYLNAVGYNVFTLDGIIGKKSNRQLIEALQEYEFESDDQAGSDEISILQQSKNDGTGFSKINIGITLENLKKIMDAETAKLFVASNRNITTADAFEILDFKGRKAVKMSISMNDTGHPDDWGRFGQSGTAQRIQVQEKPKVHEMRDGEAYWYKFSLFIPNNVGSAYHTISPFDLKDRKRGGQRDPALAFTITNNQVTFQLKTVGEECRKIKNMQGKLSDFCERPGLIANMGSNIKFKNEWLDFVFQIDLREHQEITRFWINENLVGVINGDLSPEGKFLGFKFGPYRFSIKKPPKDEVLYYADIMRRNSCEELDQVNCKKLKASPTSNGIFGADELIRCFKEPEQDKPCKLICVGIACEKL